VYSCWEPIIPTDPFAGAWSEEKARRQAVSQPVDWQVAGAALDSATGTVDLDTLLADVAATRSRTLAHSDLDA
jgi:hypothetical protein